MTAASPSIYVYTALTGNRDILRETQCVTGASFVAFVDRPCDSSVWEERRAYDRFLSPRRNSRIHKILAHQYINAEYSLWMDANISLLTPAPELFKEWLANADLAVFRHHARSCLYEEASVCQSRELDERMVIAEQVAKYRGTGYPESQGLGECCVILRRHTAEVAAFNDCWWSEYCRHSVRDQISFMYAAAARGLPIHFIEPNKKQNLHFDILDRSAEPEPPNPRAQSLWVRGEF